MRRAGRAREPRATRRVFTPCVATALVLSVAAAAPVAADEDAGETPTFVRPEAAAMGEGGWMESSQPSAPAGAAEADAGAALTAAGIQRDLEEQLVAGVPRPRIDLNIEFEFNSADLTPSGRSDLDAAGEAMSRHFEDKSFVLAGHTDASGPADYNLELSRLRAQSARRYLIEAHGIAPERLDAKGYGETRLIENGPPEKNRRVVLELLR